MKRNSAIDFTRSVAILLIVSCHFLLFGGVDGLRPFGRYIAGIGNFLFFFFSAYLFGKRYENNGVLSFNARTFLPKRWVRLFSSLWPMLIIILGIYFYFGVDLSIPKVIMNFIGLCWFAKIPSLGHLWFVTMIIFCYIMYVSITMCEVKKISNAKVVGGDFVYFNSIFIK